VGDTELRHHDPLWTTLSALVLAVALAAGMIFFLR
jgi:hypothetical protein